MPRFPQVAPSLAEISGAVYSTLAHRLARHPGETFPLHVGDTWMEPPEGCWMEDLRVAEHPGMHRYAPVQGLPGLIEAIVERTRERTGLAIQPENVLVAAGATGGLGAVAGAILQPGDEVLILAPYWPLISGIVRAFHGIPVPVPFFAGPDAADSPETAVEAVAALRSERTVALYYSTPNNPSGRVIPRAWLEALAEWGRRENLWLISDEVYEEYVYRGEHTPGLPLAPERTFAAHSFSKSYGMAGNRCGHVIGPSEVMGDLRKVSTHSFYSTPTASQLAAQRVLAGAGEPWVRKAREHYREVGTWAAERLGVPPPEGSTFLFLDLAGHLDGRGLGGFLEDCVNRGLLLAPGPSCGPYPHHARLCFTAAPPEVVKRGVEVLAGLLGR